jgi:ATP-binding cassette subfamily F protein 3
VEIGGGGALVYPGTYEEFLWSRKQREVEGANASRRPVVPAVQPTARKNEAVGSSGSNGGGTVQPPKAQAQISYEDRKRLEADARRDKKAIDARQRRIADLEARIADREQAIKDIESSMSDPGFYDDHETAKPVIDRHQALMWEVGDLMHQWEELQTDS